MVWPVDWRYDFGIMFKVFPASITCLNIFGMLLAVFLYFKGLYFPSTADSGTTGSLLKDFCWGTELYPKVFGVDIKRFINCRFSMTYWMLAGLSFSHHAHSLREDGQPFDWGLFLAGVSQFLYLVKFFEWEIGYMRSIDIIVDRAGWEIQWGCLVWVPSVYTLHSRFCVLHPSGLGPLCAGSIFGLGMLGVLLNYWADVQRKNFREANGECLIWGKPPVFVEAQYQVIDPKSGKATKRSSLLLASGFWGIARHFHYVFELTAAYSWCFLANPLQNGTMNTNEAERTQPKLSNNFNSFISVPSMTTCATSISLNYFFTTNTHFNFRSLIPIRLLAPLLLFIFDNLVGRTS